METIKMLKCEIHGITEHVLYSGRYRCKKCFVHYNNEKRKRYKQLLVEYKGGECEICGYKKCIGALEFHHKDPSQKLFGISDGSFNKKISELKKEADKCILVCANCHREIHENEEKEKYSKEKKRLTAKDKINKNVLNEMLKENKTQKEIAKFFNVSISTLKRYLKSLNTVPDILS